MLRGAVLALMARKPCGVGIRLACIVLMDDANVSIVYSPSL
jgi:hypothetical protein